MKKIFEKILVDDKEYEVIIEKKKICTDSGQKKSNFLL